MLFADDKGRIYDHPRLLMIGRSGPREILPESGRCIPMPAMSRLFYLPGCPPRGMDPETGKIITLKREKVGKRTIRCHAVAAFLEPGYVRTLLPAADTSRKGYVLPLWAYTAVGFCDGRYMVPAFQVEYNPHWDPRNFDDREMLPLLRERVKASPRNSLIRHLAHCAVRNHCFAAKNLFLRRWEAPLPTSRRCNARCLGCLSRQPRDSCPAAHRRIVFRPTVEEILEVALPHLEHAPEAIVSFGQGCEGEPLTETALIAEAIRAIRTRTGGGTLNLNTNGSLPEALRVLIDAGLDSVRISLNSVRPELYRAYVRPKGFTFEDVKRSIALCRESGIFTMINYLVFPGITDQEEEWEALCRLIRETGINFIHLKNLCIDPDLYLQTMPSGDSPPMGLETLAGRLRETFPGIQLGYFNQPARPRKAVLQGNQS
jgi:pyruvate-formate lyase-activating enzyme